MQFWAIATVTSHLKAWGLKFSSETFSKPKQHVPNIPFMKSNLACFPFININPILFYFGEL